MFNREFSDILNYGGYVYDGMKGLVTQDGDVVSWNTDTNGQPHHDDVDPEGIRMLQLANYTKLMSSISIDGYRPPLEYISDILGYFKDYKADTEIHIDIGSKYGDFRFDGSVLLLKEFFKVYPPPIAEDYEDDVKDKDWQEDYEEWTKKINKKPTMTARAALGRGGREDVWQEKDEEWSKGFSVYNNNPLLNKPEPFEKDEMIVGEIGDYFITVDDIENAMVARAYVSRYSGIYDRNNKKPVGYIEMKDGECGGSRRSRWLDVREIYVQKAHEGKGVASLLYEAILRYMHKRYSGISSYLPNRINKTQIPHIYKKLGGYEEGDCAYILRTETYKGKK